MLLKELSMRGHWFSITIEVYYEFLHSSKSKWKEKLGQCICNLPVLLPPQEPPATGFSIQYSICGKFCDTGWVVARWGDQVNQWRTIELGWRTSSTSLLVWKVQRYIGSNVALLGFSVAAKWLLCESINKIGLQVARILKARPGGRAGTKFSKP